NCNSKEETNERSSDLDEVSEGHPRRGRLRRVVHHRGRRRALLPRGVQGPGSGHHDQGEHDRGADPADSVVANRGIGARHSGRRGYETWTHRSNSKEQTMRMILPLVSMLVVAALAAAIDVRTGRIPNWLTLGSLPFSILLQIALGASRGGLRG